MRHSTTLCLSIALMIQFLSAAPDCSTCHTGRALSKPVRMAGLSEKAVGVMDKGQLQNNTSNFGDLANFHAWYTNAGHWPRTARDDHQYLFGLGLIVAVNDTNVIETVSQALSKITDWLPPDDAAGRDYSGEIRAASDQTPFQASSDFRETWPRGYYDDNGNWVSTSDRHWPGHFRIDVNRPDFPDTLVERPGEFTSDRDIYCRYNDDYNSKGRVGLTVEQTAYSYGRPYAEDFVFWRLDLTNTSGHDLDSIWVGFQGRFRPDYDNHDYIKLIDSDGDGRPDLIYVYDLNNQPDKTWAQTEDPLGMVGLRIYDTPYDLGITDFHHFARGVSPTRDEELWALITSDSSSSALSDPRYYFHGSDRRIDDTSDDSLETYYPSWLDENSGVEYAGEAINFVVGSGPFRLPADSTVTITIGLIMGASGDTPFEPDTTDLMYNVRIANKMHSVYFQGSGPPEPPVVGAVPGDHKVTLYWSAEPSESSVDVLTGERDFEGYKIFRSTDQGRTWGKVVTDGHGNPVGYEPIATFDLVDEVEGPDPAFPQYLGTNSGLVHTFVDSNLINGVEYWYCVTAYDKGNQNPDSLEQSYMYPLGTSTFEPHTVAVVPGPRAVNLETAEVPAGELQAQGGFCTGTVRVTLIDPDSITGHTYKLTFSDTALEISASGDTSYVKGFTLWDSTTGDTLFNNLPLSAAEGDRLPVVHGFRLSLEDSPGGVAFIGWTKVQGDTCTFDWRTKSKYPELGNMAIQETIETYDDFKITVDTANGENVRWFDIFYDIWQDTTQYLPLRVEVITDPDNPIDVTANTVICDFAISQPWETYRKYYFSPLGWDLVPGGKGFTPGSDHNGWWYEMHVDVLMLTTDNSDTLRNFMFLMTNNFPEEYIDRYGNVIHRTPHPPSQGDEFTIKTYKPFRPEIYYVFDTKALKPTAAAETNPLANVKVVPDPYIVTNAWETNEFGKRLQFNNLPDQCTIRIYTLAGDWVATVEHNGNTGYEFWDMRTHNDTFIAPGVYLYYAETPDGHTKVGRFLVIR